MDLIRAEISCRSTRRFEFSASTDLPGTLPLRVPTFPLTTRRANGIVGSDGVTAGFVLLSSFLFCVLCFDLDKPVFSTGLAGSIRLLKWLFEMICVFFVFVDKEVYSQELSPDSICFALFPLRKFHT